LFQYFYEGIDFFFCSGTANDTKISVYIFYKTVIQQFSILIQHYPKRDACIKGFVLSQQFFSTCILQLFFISGFMYYQVDDNVIICKEFFAGKIWQLMTSCYERRENDYERLGWWEFTGADGRSQAYADLLARGLTRTLVAARAKTASTKTGGDIFLQLIFNMANPSVATDRILNGPTNERWLHPWHEYLVRKRVDYRFLSDVVKIDCDPKSKKITGVWVQKLKESKGPFVEALHRSELSPPEKFTAVNVSTWLAGLSGSATIWPFIGAPDLPIHLTRFVPSKLS